MFNIALNTFREIIRNKFFGLIAFLGIVFILFSLVLDTLALGETRRVLFDFWLSFIEITGCVIILLLGGNMIAREIEWRTIYLLLSKPIRRGYIVLGKFLWFTIVMSLVLLIESLVLLIVLSSMWFAPDGVFFLALVGIWLKFEVLLALILFFSTWVSPMIAMFLTLMSYIIGHSWYVVLDFANSHNWFISHIFSRFLLAIFPNFESLNIKNYVATDALISINSSMLAFLLAAIYIFCVVYSAIYIFERKSFDTV